MMKKWNFSPIPFWDIIKVAFFVAVYFIAFQIAYLFPDAQNILLAIWPASGIGLAALLLSPRRLWFVILASFFIVGNISNLMIDRPLFNSIGFMIANVIESYACAWVIVRWCGEDIRFNTVKEISALIFGAIVVNAVTAVIGGGTAWIASISPFWSFWTFWWIADGLGILILAPLIVVWASFRDISIRDNWKIGLEAGIFMAIWYKISHLSFHVQASDIDPFTARPYLLIALLAYAAIRLGQRGVTLSIAILSVIAITSEAISTSPSPLGGQTMNYRLLLLQLFLSCIAITGYILAASYSESRSAERLSREEQSRIRALGDNLPDGMVYQVVHEKDGSMRFLYLSAGIEKLDGISAKEGLRDPSKIYNLYLEEDRKMIAAAEEISLREMRTFNVVARLHRPDGQLRWMQLSASPRRLEDGRILWDGIQMDITERKKAEEALQASEKKYRKLYESMMDGYAYVSMDGIVQEYNESFRNMLGYTSLELKNMTYEDITPEKWHEFEQKIIREQILIRGYSDIYEKEYRKKNGTIFPVEIRTFLIRNETGENEGMWAVVRDITERRRSEEEARLNSLIFKNVSEGISLLGMEDGKIKHTNSMFEKIFGYEPGEMIGKEISNLNAPTDKTPLETEMEIMDILRKSGEWHGEVKNIRKDGTPFWSYANVSIFDHPQYGKVVVNVHTDITERKRIQEELQIAHIKYKTLFSAFPLGITVADRTGKILESNPMAERLLSLSLEEQHQRKIDGKEWTIVKPDRTPLQAQDYASVRALRENRMVENMEMGIVKAHGEITWINVNAAPLPLEGYGVVITYNDITQRKKAEAELHLLNQTLEAAQSMAKVGYWSYNMRTDIFTWSEQMFVIFGVNPGSGVLHYDEHRKILHPDDWKLFDTSVQECKKGKPYNIVIRLIFPDKSIHYINTQGLPGYNEKGEISELFGTSQDITEHKKNEEELRKHREHLEELVKERTAQLNQKNEELEQFNRFFVGRELRMIQLKEQIAGLEKKIAELEKKNEDIKEPRLNSKEGNHI